jgi:hypothetical protein
MDAGVHGPRTKNACRWRMHRSCSCGVSAWRDMAALPLERTLCPHCGLATPTASDGVCVECWEDKSKRSVYAPGKKPFPEPPRPQAGGGGFFGVSDLLWYGVFDDFFDDLFDDLFDVEFLQPDREHPRGRSE